MSTSTRTWPAGPVPVDGVRVGAVDRDEAADRAVKVLSAGGRGRSTWNVYDIRGVVEEVLAARNVIAPPEVFTELAEDVTARALARCLSVLDRPVPDHIRHLTSQQVIDLEHDIIGRLAVRAGIDHQYAAVEDVAAALDRLSHPDGGGEPVLLDEGQVAAVRAITGTGPLVLIEGAAGAGKTTVLSTANDIITHHGHTHDGGRAVEEGGHGRRRGNRVRATRPPPTGWRTSTGSGGTPTGSGPGSGRGTPTRSPGTSTPGRTPPRGSRRGMCWWSTRPGCWTRKPPAPCCTSPTRPTPGWCSSGTAGNSPRSAAAGCWTWSPAGRPPRSSSARCTGSAPPTTSRTPGTRTSPCGSAPASTPRRCSTTSHQRGHVKVWDTEADALGHLAWETAHRHLDGVSQAVSVATNDDAAAVNEVVREQLVTAGAVDDTTRHPRLRRAPDRRRRPGHDPAERPRPRGREPDDLDRHRHHRPPRASSCTTRPAGNTRPSTPTTCGTTCTWPTPPPCTASKATPPTTATSSCPTPPTPPPSTSGSPAAGTRTPCTSSPAPSTRPGSSGSHAAGRNRADLGLDQARAAAAAEARDYAPTAERDTGHPAPGAGRDRRVSFAERMERVNARLARTTTPAAAGESAAAAADEYQAEYEAGHQHRQSGPRL